ncbi:MAG: PilT/PilU family type 4a pilus ATPase [Victivallaceae bacterium]|nr:PilT/PilU family type 4a pilus ATPase [Victivallaceae bacterium]NLK82958.1 PilT/PilU family type 4a pilus ATPase [Lentisphaerota bacterium]MDD3115870.1 PilT/PilU family type 4a pilus ATPase [Victivallaceae bacterium]MDD3703216.1 PilT/PilU family type 4a pilus ATPase [Victivallaceae bacterium]MDD4317097.1 PilT/PilU family type 4a pilus ATPase [Victivallaceae bacterium]
MANTVFHNLFDYAVSNGASDIHIKENAPVSLRIDGGIVPTDFTPDFEMMMRFVSDIASEEQIDRLNKTGDLDLSHLEDEVGRFRINFHHQRNSLSISLRHVKNKVMTFDELGLPPTLHKISERQRGIIFMTGTTGSGKSTTLAAILEHINANYAKHVITIEDPIEYEFEDKKSFFEQREVGIDTESFASALKHALRQDPDVIMVGEMRDRNSFETALQAADTGHLVLTTLHASNSAQSITRILDFFQQSEHEQIRESLANNLAAIVSQRLIPRALGDGRVPACEIMLNTPLITKLLLEDKLEKLSAAIGAGRNEGMQTFNQCLYDQVQEGIISEEDALLHSDNPGQLKMNFQGIFLSQGDNQIVG